MRVQKQMTAKPQSDDNSPDDSPNTGGRPLRFTPTGERIEDVTFTRYYQRGYFRNEDGTPDESRRVILAVETKRVMDSDGKATNREFPTPIWEGDIRVIGRVLSYKINSSRRLKVPEWHEYIRAESVTNAPNARPNRGLLASMDIIQRKERALWMEKLGVTLSGQTFRIAEFIRILAMRENRTLMIQGQGPLYLDDGSPDGGEFLDGELIFSTRSRVFDTHGEKREIEADLGSLPDKSDYYDLTPPDEITDDQIREGLEKFRESFGECTPKYAAIPAAFVGQLFAGWLSAIRIDFWSAIHLTGEKGSGKSYYCLRFDSIQARNSPVTRGTLTEMKPVLNLGDATGTRKGPKYTVTNFGGFTITCDDALKKGATETEIRNQSDNVSNLIRSQEAGGAALAKVDRDRNEVTASESPALHSSVKIPSEIPVIGESTLDRMIVLPHITDHWQSGTVFNRAMSEELSTAGSRELMHRAYSAFVAWAFQRIPTDVEKCLTQAKAETGSWDIPARTADRYAAVLAGIYMLERFANEYEIDMRAQIESATRALKECARAQTGSNTPVAIQWARELRRAIASHRVAFPGPPILSDDGSHAKPYDLPGIAKAVKNDSGPDEIIRVMPWDGAVFEDFGMESLTKAPHPRATIYGYLIPPESLRNDKSKGGRPNTNPLADKWLVALTKERFEDLCRDMSRDYGYEPATLMRSLTDLELGDKGMKISVSNASDRKRLWVFSAELLRAVDDEGEE